MACNNGSSLFGSSEKYIKFLNSDLVAIEGANTVERQFLKDVRIKYAQILKGRIILKPGQVDYLLNHLGLGDNATFLSIAATYDPKSKVEADNYVLYNFADDLSKNHYFAQIMILSGNSTYRVPQLFLTNPNAKYAVALDVMVAVIDDNYSFFTDTSGQSGLSFVGLEVGDIHTYVVNESIVIKDKSTPAKPLIYLKLANINSVERSGLVVTVDDQSLGTVLLKFKTVNDAAQALSLFNYVLENPNIDIDTLSPLEDEVDPIIYFYSQVGGSGDFIAFNGSTASLPYNTSSGNTFSTSLSITTWGTQSAITKTRLVELIVASASDNRDGPLIVTASNILLSGTAGTVSTINSAGTYSMTFDFSDLALNNLVGVVLNLTITS